jgi:two-component system phosphate regulon sensor histidine kinase PhoR
MIYLSTILIFILIITLIAFFLYYFLLKNKRIFSTFSDTDINNKIKENENFLKIYKNILQQVTDGIAVIDENKNIIFVNSSFRKNIRSGLSDNVNRFELLTRNYELNNIINKIIENNDSNIIEKKISYFDKADEKIVSCKIFKINETKYYAVIIRDITYIQKIENIKSAFIQNISHEIKTPITAIRGFIETLKNGALDNRETAVKFFNIIDHHAKRLNSLIDDLIVLTNIETGGASLKIEKIDPINIIENSLQLFENEIRAKNLKIIKNLDCFDGAAFFSDFSKINQIIINMLQNSIKYTEHNGKVSIDLYFETNSGANNIIADLSETSIVWGTIDPTADNFLYISVEDTGIGVSYPNLLRLGERFFRVDSSHSADPGGTGLGLAIIKHILKLLNGTAILQSSLGNGFTFTVLIPQTGISRLNGKDNNIMTA